MKMDFAIDTAAVMEMAAKKVADEILGEHGEFLDAVQSDINKRVKEAVEAVSGASLRENVDAVLKKNLEELLDRQIIPVDIWGERTSKEPTNIRDQLHKRALEFWEERVEKDGKRTTYGGEPRYKHVYKQITEEAFNDAIKKNVNEIVVAFNSALKADSAKLINDHINNLIKTPR